MMQAAAAYTEIPRRGQPKSPFIWAGHEVIDIFLPIMGTDCLAIYMHFARRVHFDPKLTHSIRTVADATNLGIATVSRSLVILEHLELIQLTRFGGSKNSECLLRDSREVATRLGVKYHKKDSSFSLPTDVAERLCAEVSMLREKQNKPLEIRSRNTGNRPPAVSQRNASVSPAIRQRSTRETQTTLHLLQEEKRIKDDPSPTPSHGRSIENTNALPDDDEAPRCEDLTWARAKFDGVMKDMQSHLLATSRPECSQLANGFTDLQRFRFDSLAVARVRQDGATPVVTLHSKDSTAARRGLNKYHKKWDESIRKWFGCDVHVELISAGAADEGPTRNC